MKKLIAFVLCFVLATSFVISGFAMDAALNTWEPSSTEYTEIPRDSDVIARIVIGSDVHIGDRHASPKLRNMYYAIGELGGADAVILAGDLTDHGREAQYDELMKIVSAGSQTLTVDNDGFSMQASGTAVGTTILMMGNHEYYDSGAKAQNRFMTKTGQALDKLYWINDKVPVIKVSMTSSVYKDNYVSKYDFIKGALDEITATGYTGHIFFVTHMPTGDSVIGSPEEANEPFSKEIIDLLKNYPQLIHVSGHSHNSPYNASFIDQSLGFTCITDGVAGEDFNEDTGDGSTVILFDVKSDGTTEFHRIDLQNAKILYDHEEWVLNSSDTPEDFIYYATASEATNPNAYSLKSKAPKFPSDATVTVKDNGNYDSIDVTFSSTAIPASINNHDNIRRYRVRATPVDGDGVTITKYVNDDSYLADHLRAKTMTTTLVGLDWDCEYEIKVIAITSFGKTSKAIQPAETVNIGRPELSDNLSKIYNVDYSYGDTSDSLGHSANVSMLAKMEYDDTIGQKAMTFNAFKTTTYSFKRETPESFSGGFSLETYFYLTDNQTKQSIVSMYDSCGLELYVEDGLLNVLFGAVGASDNRPVSTEIPADEWIHAILVYNCKDAMIYINGELVASARHSGGFEGDIDEDKTDDELLVHLGGRCSSGAESHLMKKGSKINCFRLYSGIMDESDVATSYAKAICPNEVILFEDIAESDWYYSNVAYAFDEGLMNGASATVFDPSSNTSRAMIVQMLYNMEGRPDVAYNSVFTDVAENAWYADAVIWAYENGVTTGSSATTFSPDDLVTREQVAVFLYRYMKDYKGAEMAAGADVSVFPDADKISPYAGFAEAIAWANGAGIITGKSSGSSVTLAPLDKAQRCETATMFSRFHKSFVALP